MRTLGLLSAVMYILLLTSCGNNRKSTDLLTSDDVHIAIDETFRPIMEEEMRVFNLRTPEAEMKPVYCDEVEALNLFLKDSVRVAITTRELSKEEAAAIRANKLYYRFQRIATDALALIVNKENPDTLMTMSALRGIVTGRITHWEQIPQAKSKGELEVVFDNPNSSTVRYIKDSICIKEPLKGNLRAQQTNTDVISYVAQTRNAIGIVGVDWIGNEDDSTNLSFNEQIKVMRVSRSAIAERGNSYLPLQYYIGTGNYPLTRAVYMLSSDPNVRSTTLNFYYFVSDTPGQLIITKSSQLLPYMPVQYKEVSISD